jgi:hypothetical protein
MDRPLINIPTALWALELRPGASAAEVRAAFRRLARRYHPDHNKEPRATETFHAITEAHRFLLSARCRACGRPLGESVGEACPAGADHGRRLDPPDPEQLRPTRPARPGSRRRRVRPEVPRPVVGGLQRVGTVRPASRASGMRRWRRVAAGVAVLVVCGGAVVLWQPWGRTIPNSPKQPAGTLATDSVKPPVRSVAAEPGVVRGLNRSDFEKDRAPVATVAETIAEPETGVAVPTVDGVDEIGVAEITDWQDPAHAGERAAAADVGAPSLAPRPFPSHGLEALRGLNVADISAARQEAPAELTGEPPPAPSASPPFAAALPDLPLGVEHIGPGDDSNAKTTAPRAKPLSPPLHATHEAHVPDWDSIRVADEEDDDTAAASGPRGTLPVGLAEPQEPDDIDPVRGLIESPEAGLVSTETDIEQDAGGSDADDNPDHADDDDGADGATGER